ncbi:MAG TPA: A/G-specific adenine glycosylase [Verrucomicrobiae bacterium]|nr:A/G-specific adenine glycosylase [Verrucomicrobiae bacterium]
MAGPLIALVLAAEQLLSCATIPAPKMNLSGTSLRASAAGRFRTRLLAWYDANARELPWRQKPGSRKSHDPYRIWLSEIMLQQTRVAAVIEHYHEFLRRFPTVEKLASAREASVLAAWSGLGYYRRARMLHAAAKQIVRKLRGKFPPTAGAWQELPGIGRYTAAAIASIAFAEPVAVVDGNVERVLQRFSGKALKPENLWLAAEGLLDRDRPGDFNQAMMELGATVCTPRCPMCLTCPVVELCATRGEMKLAPKAEPQRKQEVHYTLDCRDGSVFLVRRPLDARLMPGMWELPELFPPADPRKPRFAVRHSITVTDYTVQVWSLPAPKSAAGKWVATNKLERLPLTGLTRKILGKARVL